MIWYWYVGCSKSIDRYENIAHASNDWNGFCEAVWNNKHAEESIINKQMLRCCLARSYKIWRNQWYARLLLSAIWIYARKARIVREQCVGERVGTVGRFFPSTWRENPHLLGLYFYSISIFENFVCPPWRPRPCTLVTASHQIRVVGAVHRNRLKPYVRYMAFQ